MAVVPQSKNEIGIVPLNTNIQTKSTIVRQSLIDTAVQFLISPKISTYNDETKKKFLEKKGMAVEEIKMAMSQAKQMKSQNYHGPDYQLMARSILPPPALPRRNSFWNTLHNFAQFSIFMSGIAFGLHYIYLHYLQPYLTGRKPKTIEDKILEIQHSLMDILKQINTTLERMDKNIVEHTNVIQKLQDSEDVAKEHPEFLEIKNEISTIKGLLINRKAFPSPPSVVSSIPKWQVMSSNAEEGNTNLINGDHETKNNEDEKTETSKEEMSDSSE